MQTAIGSAGRQGIQSKAWNVNFEVANEPDRLSERIMGVHKVSKEMGAAAGHYCSVVGQRASHLCPGFRSRTVYLFALLKTPRIPRIITDFKSVKSVESVAFFYCLGRLNLVIRS